MSLISMNVRLEREDDAPRMFGVDATAQQSCHAKTVNFASLDLSRYQK
jgi:hypothetical protein